jgi:hypothetical protein
MNKLYITKIVKRNTLLEDLKSTTNEYKLVIYEYETKRINPSYRPNYNLIVRKRVRERIKK